MRRWLIASAATAAIVAGVLVAASGSSEPPAEPVAGAPATAGTRPTSVTPSAAEPTSAPTTAPAPTPSPSPSPSATPAPAPKPTAKPKPRRQLGPLHNVLSVTDGDTIRVAYQGASEPVRFIGIDTPETRHPSRPVECFGPEASNFTARLLNGQRVHLVRDGAQGDRDPYDRLLRFVFTADGKNVNVMLVRRGYATYEDRYPIAEPYRTQLRRAQDKARQDDRGLWSACRR